MAAELARHAVSIPGAERFDPLGTDGSCRGPVSPKPHSPLSAPARTVHRHPALPFVKTRGSRPLGAAGDVNGRVAENAL